MNDVTQPIDANTENNEIAENAPIGAEVGIDVLLANDDDASDNVTYSLTSDLSGAFSIDTVSGSIFKSGLDFEDGKANMKSRYWQQAQMNQSEARFIVDAMM